MSNAFEGLGDMLNMGGLDALTATSGSDYSLLPIEDISIKAQVREEFEDEENTLADLAESIKAHGIIQPIVVRPLDGGDKPYELVAGERRLRAALLAELVDIPAIVRPMTDDEAEELQVAENIHRKNLTQKEVAKRLQRDLDQLGSVDAVMAKHQKSRAWVSKWLSLLDLPEQAARVVDENISADLEVINAVKQVEKADPEAAKELVDNLKEGRGKKGENAREKAQAAKDKVKPPKKPRKEKLPPAPVVDPEAVAQPIDRSHEEPGPVVSIPVDDQEQAENGFDAFAALVDGTDNQGAADFADAKTDDDQEQAEPEAMPWDAPQEAAQEAQDEPQDQAEADSSVPALPPAAALAGAYKGVFEEGRSAKTILEAMSAEERDNCEAWLTSFYEAGTSAKDVASAVIQGFRSGQFSTEGHGAFALAAFLYGLDYEGKFSMLNILGSVKK